MHHWNTVPLMGILSDVTTQELDEQVCIVLVTIDRSIWDEMQLNMFCSRGNVLLSVVSTLSKLWIDTSKLVMHFDFTLKDLQIVYYHSANYIRDYLYFILSIYFVCSPYFENHTAAKVYFLVCAALHGITNNLIPMTEVVDKN